MKRRLINKNHDEVVRILFRHHGLRFDNYAKTLYHSHPRYGYIEAITYILSRFGIDTSLIQTDLEEIKGLPFPLVVNFDGLFLPIVGMKNDETVFLINESGETEEVLLRNFSHVWDGRALVMEEDGKGKGNIAKDKAIWRANRLLIIISGLIFACAALYFSGRAICCQSIIRDLFLLSSIAGLAVSVLFHVQRLDRGNPLVNKICHSSAGHSSKRDCSSILDSNASKFLGVLSWVDVGSVYFLLFLSIVWFMLAPEAMTVLALVSLFAAAYIPYSIFYQAKKAKRWCALCLSIQAILLFNAAISIVFLMNEGVLVGNLWMTAIMIVVISIIVASVYSLVLNCITSLYLLKERDKKHRELLFSAGGFQFLIQETPVVDFSLSPKLPVIEKEGDAEVTMIINPKCSPCMKKTREVLEILNRKRYTKLSVVFFVDPKTEEEVALAKKLISESLSGNLSAALENHVNRFPDVSDIDNITNIHPKAQDILDSSFKWCKNNRFMSTPKIFLNNHEWPSLYSVKDIDYLVE